MPAEDALAYLAHWGDTLQSRGRTLFVVELPSNPEGEAVLDAVIAAAGAAEDREDDDPGGDPLDRGEFDPCDLGEPEQYLDG
jgi:hypothetical protein